MGTTAVAKEFPPQDRMSTFSCRRSATSKSYLGEGEGGSKDDCFGDSDCGVVIFRAKMRT